MNYTLKEWLEELESRFGKDKNNWAFKCPACGKVSTAKEFVDVGGDVNNAYQCCIGRFTGKGSPTEDSKDGCNWAAYGFLHNLGKGDIITTEDRRTTEVFSMADKKVVL